MGWTVFVIGILIALILAELDARRTAARRRKSTIEMVCTDCGVVRRVQCHRDWPVNAMRGFTQCFECGPGNEPVEFVRAGGSVRPFPSSPSGPPPPKPRN